jgi:hypothetical protein
MNFLNFKTEARKLHTLQEEEILKLEKEVQELRFAINNPKPKELLGKKYERNGHIWEVVGMYVSFGNDSWIIRLKPEQVSDYTSKVLLDSKDYNQAACIGSLYKNVPLDVLINPYKEV